MKEQTKKWVMKIGIKSKQQRNLRNFGQFILETAKDLGESADIVVMDTLYELMK